MANEKHLRILKQGAKAWNKWRKHNPEEVLDLREARLTSSLLADTNLSNALLRGTDLSLVDLSNGSLTRANLSEANLFGARLHGADLQRANLRGAHLRNANLRMADLRGANLREVGLGLALLIDADLSGADLTSAVMWSTVIGGTDLTGATGLETVQHDGPSIVDIDTIYRSGAGIPEVFLRGAGVPDSFIVYMKSLLGTQGAFEFYSCFISYSTQDQNFADRLYADLQISGVRCWFAPHDVRAGYKLHEQIDQAIRLHEKLLLILSPDSMNSEWVKTEIAKARQREVREKKQVLFPVRLCSFEALRDWECFDADTGKDSAREIREYFIPDFSNWKDPDSYQNALARLLRDLKADQAEVQTP